jgi:5-formyltetrahydrofolate cyclo-ligase
MDLAAEKRRLRRSVGARRSGIPAADSATASERICRALLAAFDFSAGQRVGLYAALPDEVPTRPLFEALAGLGVVCLFPRVLDDRRLVFGRVEAWDEMRVGVFGVLAPAEAAPAVSFEAGDLVLVPGIAFDCHGARLGHGAGCYDRTFPRDGGPAARLCGVAYEVQIEDSIPTASHDRAMDAIVTERGFRWTRGEQR